MKNILKSVLLTFNMFSTIPTPRVEWSNENRRHVFTFFPLIGLLIGILEAVWLWLYKTYSLETLLYATVAGIIPILLTGGIHLDGFVDSCDAFFSYTDKKKKLEILSDPHVGAFGMIYLLVYLLFSAGIWAQISVIDYQWLLYLAPFVLSRILAGFLIMLEKPAKDSGLMVAFKNHDKKDKTIFFLIVWLLAVIILLGWIHLWYMVLNLLLTALFILWFRRYAYNQFGGFTGDLIGFSICMDEIISLLSIALGGMFHWI